MDTAVKTQQTKNIFQSINIENNFKKLFCFWTDLIIARENLNTIRSFTVNYNFFTIML